MVVVVVVVTMPVQSGERGVGRVWADGGGRDGAGEEATDAATLQGHRLAGFRPLLGAAVVNTHDSLAQGEQEEHQETRMRMNGDDGNSDSRGNARQYVHQRRWWERLAKALPAHASSVFVRR